MQELVIRGQDITMDLVKHISVCIGTGVQEGDVITMDGQGGRKLLASWNLKEVL